MLLLPLCGHALKLHLNSAHAVCWDRGSLGGIGCLKNGFVSLKSIPSRCPLDVLWSNLCILRVEYSCCPIRDQSWGTISPSLNDLTIAISKWAMCIYRLFNLTTHQHTFSVLRLALTSLDFLLRQCKSPYVKPWSSKYSLLFSRSLRPANTTANTQRIWWILRRIWSRRDTMRSNFNTAKSTLRGASCLRWDWMSVSFKGAPSLVYPPYLPASPTPQAPAISLHRLWVLSRHGGESVDGACLWVSQGWGSVEVQWLRQRGLSVTESTSCLTSTQLRPSLHPEATHNP